MKKIFFISIIFLFLLFPLLRGTVEAQSADQPPTFVSVIPKNQKYSLGGIADLFIGQDGYFYTLSTYGTIRVLDSNGNNIREFDGGPNAKLENSYKFADCNNSIYVSDGSSHRIQRFSYDGSSIMMWGSLGSADGQFNNPRGIACDSSGDMYVADRLNHRIQKFDKDGTFIMKWGTNGTADGQFKEPYGLFISPENVIHTVEYSGHRIQKFNPDGQFLAKWGSYGTTDGLLNNPLDITVDNEGRYFVVEFTTKRIQVFSDTGAFLFKFGSAGSLPGQFTFLYNIYSNNGKIYVPDYANSRIQVFDSNGNFEQEIGNSPAENYIKYSALEIYKGELFASRREYIDVYDFYGNFKRTIGQPGQFIYISAMETDNFGNLYVVDSSGKNVHKLDKNGNPILVWGGAGSGDGQFQNPSDIGIDSEGNVYVGDNINRNVQKFDKDGGYLTKWGSSGSDNGQFIGILGLAIDKDNYVYVLDISLHRVQKFDKNGSFITKFGSLGSGDGQLRYPAGMDVSNDGYVYVLDKDNHRVVKFDVNGTYITKWGGGGNSVGRFGNPSRGMKVDNSGRIFVSDYVNSRIQIFAYDNEPPIKTIQSEMIYDENTNTIKVSLGAEDNIYPISDLEMQISFLEDFSDSTWINYTEAIMLDPSLGTKVYVRFKDKAGNISEGYFIDLSQVQLSKTGGTLIVIYYPFIFLFSISILKLVTLRKDQIAED